MGTEFSNPVGSSAAILHIGVDTLSPNLTQKIVSSGLSVIPLQDSEALKKIEQTGLLDCVDAILISDHEFCEGFLADLFTCLEDEAYQYIPVFRRTEKDGCDKCSETWEHRYNSQFDQDGWETDMFPVLDASINEYRRQRKFLQEIRRRSSAIGLIQAGRFVLQTPKQARNLTTMLSHACPNPTHAALAMSELLLNAIEHGNLEISYQEKSELLADGNWDTAVDSRLADPAYLMRKVIVDFERNDDHVILNITDDGNGFDWQPFMKWVPGTRFEQLHGRGIFLVRSLPGIQLEFSEGGRHVKVTMAVNQ